MAFIVIPSADVDQGSVIDESLMAGKIKNDLDDLNARTVALESLTGGAGVAVANAEDLFADLIAGGEDNLARFWKVRHHVMMNTTGLGVTGAEGLDFEEKEVHERFFHDPNFTAVSSMVSNAQTYLTNVYFIEQNEQLQVRIKKGENFFCLGIYLALANATVFRVYVDGVNVNTLGLVDENDVVVPSSFSANNATTQYGKLFQFYGLDGEEHIVTIKNENATALEVPLQYIDVGWRQPNIALDHTIMLKAGIANVGNVAASFNENSYSFTRPGIGLANGYTGMLKINQTGTITPIDGLSPASTQTKPDVNIAFSGAVTQLPVKNHWYFPDNGICMLSHPSGEQYFFSYSSKGQPGGPASQILDGIVWQAKPTEDYRPLVASAGATYVVNEWRGDLRIEYWAKPPIQISGSNNKIDFEITIDGVQTSHTATIVSGYYAADIVRIGKAVVDAMKAVKPLPVGHEYYCEYNYRSQVYSLGVRGARVSKINYRWSTGANNATSFGPVIGFSSDIIDSTSYLAPVLKQHLARRVFVQDTNIRSSEHPSIKYTWAASSTTLIAEADSLMETANLSSYRRLDTGATRVFFNIYPDEDASGISLMFMREDIGIYVTYMIDDGDETYLMQTERPTDTTSPTRGTLLHGFISFPKGSRKITVKAEVNVWFELESSTQYATFFGYRQWFTKPQWEMLNPTEKILKCVEVNPIRLFATAYGHNAALYVPQPTNDNINSITESGVWVQTTTTTIFAQRHRQTVTNGGFVDVEFVLQGHGGGIGIRRFDTTDTSREVSFYLAAGAITESTDLIERQSTDWLAAHYKKDFMHLGLPPGTYTLRMKNDDTQRMINNAIIVIDTVKPQPLARVTPDITNTGQGLAYPLNVRRRECSRYQAFRQPSYFVEGAFKRGIVHHGDYIASTHNILNRDESGDVIEESDAWWLYQILTNTGEYVGYRTFCRSLGYSTGHFSTFTTVASPLLDGRALNNFSNREQVKGGLAPSATRADNSIACFNDFEYAIAYSGTPQVFNMTDTRGLRVGQKVILYNGTTREDAFIASIVTDVSFTISKALTLMTEASVNTVFFWGFHNLKITTGGAEDHYASAFVYEPLPLEESVLATRVQSEKKEEIVTLTQVLAGTAADVNQNFEFPIHSDGEQAIPNTVEIIEIRNSVASNVTLKRGLKTFDPDSGVGVSARTIACKSRKWVPVTPNVKVNG